MLHPQAFRCDPGANSWTLKRLLRNSRFEVFERSGHMPFIEDSDLFVRRVSSFLGGLDAQD
jgi:pimeloyl-ACP methyl ester carboxylesterase